MIRNIVFDMGRVLLDGNTRLPCLRHSKDPEKARILFEAIFAHPTWSPLLDSGEVNEQAFLAQVQDRLPTEELRELAADVMDDWWLDGLWPMKGMSALVKDLLEKGCRLYVLSNCGVHFRRFQYKIPHVQQFSGIMVSAEEKLVKPDPAIFLRLCEKFELKAEECVFVDDSQKNVDGALSVGMQGYCFADADVNRLRDYLNTLLSDGE